MSLSEGTFQGEKKHTFSLYFLLKYQHRALSPFLNQRLINTFDFEGAFKNMVPTKQGGHQAAGLCVAICFGIGGGIIVGKEQPKTALKIQSVMMNSCMR